MRHPEFATRFKQAVTLAGVEDTQKSLARLIGVSEVMIWSYKNGEKLPRMAMALTIADKLNISVEWLLQGTGPRQRSAQMTEKTSIYMPKKSTQIIMELVEGLSEIERKKALQLLCTAFDQKG